MKKMIVLMIGLGVILGGCRKKEKRWDGSTIIR